MENYDIVKTLIHTEKSTSLDEPFGRYIFWVDNRANKIQIRKAVAEIYKVEVDFVNTQIVKGKAKRLRHKTGYTSDWKKAIVGLKEGHKIDTT